MSDQNQIPGFESLQSLTDREVLILVVEKLRTVSLNQCNHLKHHWAITLICCAAGLTGLFNLGIAFLLLFVKGG